MSDRYDRIKARNKNKPESLGSAGAWEQVKARYRAAGLCPVCASQAGWGHQNGFDTTLPPCADCAPLVADFPHEAVLPWRALSQTGRKHPLHAHRTVRRAVPVSQVTSTAGSI